MFKPGDRVVIEGAGQSKWNGFQGTVEEVLYNSVRIMPSQVRPDGHEFRVFMWPTSQLRRVADTPANVEQTVSALRKAIRDARALGVTVDCKITHSVPTTTTL